MASPFRVFRKNQKLMLAFLGVLVMVGFVILPILMQGMGVRRQTNTRVATTARYGDLQEANLGSLRWRRQVAIRFFEALGRAVIMAEGNPMALSRVLRDMAPSEDVGPISEEALAETWLLARRAEELGFLVDERAVVSFLDGLGQDRISKQGWAGILQSVELSEQDLVGVLRDELLAIHLKRAFRFSLQGDTPAQRWDYFQRLNRKVTIESLPVRVADFVDQVADPDEATLEEFFDRYKDKPYDPTSPDPGFREPARIKVEYLKAEYESFFEQEKKAVTADEVSAYYEANRETYRKEKLPEFFDEEPAEGKSEPAAPSDKSEPTTAEDNAPAAEAPTERTSLEPAKAEPAKAEPAKTEPAAPGAADKPASSEKEPAATEPADGMAPEAAESNEDTSALEMTSPFHLASFAPEGQDQPKASEPEQPAGASEKSTVEAAPAEKTAPEPAPKERPPAEASPPEKSAVEPPAEPPAADSTSPKKPTAEASSEKEAPTEPTSPDGPAMEAKAPEPPAVEKTPAEGPALAAEKPTGEKGEPTAKAEPKAPEGDADATAKPQYLPLEKVEDEIRGNIARERANEKIEKVLNDLRNELSRYHDKLIRYEVDVQTKEEGEAPTPPERLDFAELAKEHGLKAGPTKDNWEGAPDEWITALNAEKLDIGKSTVGGQLSFVESVFDLPNHRPQVSQDANGDRYLFWKLDQVEERVPEFDDEGVREEVLVAWKMIEARSLATEAAERMAAEAGAANNPLGEAFAERPGIAVTESEPFSWLDYGAVPAWMAQGPPSLGDVRGVEAPGNDFMRAVFDLKKGEIGTAVNQPQTAVYVVRVTDSNPLPDTLWHTFVNESYWSYFRAADHDRAVAEQAWLDGIRSETGFRWDPEYQRQAAQRRAD